jgi:hypothetical protein
MAILETTKVRKPTFRVGIARVRLDDHRPGHHTRWDWRGIGVCWRKSLLAAWPLLSVSDNVNLLIASVSISVGVGDYHLQVTDFFPMGIPQNDGVHLHLTDFSETVTDT